MKRQFLFLQWAGALLLACPAAHAQTIPRSVEADSLSKEAQPVPQPSLPPEIEAAPSMAVQAPQGAEKVHFTLRKIAVIRVIAAAT